MIIVLALKGIMKTLYSLGICIYHSSEICTPYAADNMQIRLTDKQKIADAITSLEGKVLEMAHWGDELNEEEIEEGVYLGKALIKMVGDPRPLFIIKLNQEVMWRTGNQRVALVVALIVLGGIYGMSNQGNNRKADAASLYSWRMEVDSLQ
jgi:hypothetical protein